MVCFILTELFVQIISIFQGIKMDTNNTTQAYANYPLGDKKNDGFGNGKL